MEISQKYRNGTSKVVNIESEHQEGKKAYASPSLKSLGMLSVLTLGGSFGADDSAGPENTKP